MRILCTAALILLAACASPEPVTKVETAAWDQFNHVRKICEKVTVAFQKKELPFSCEVDNQLLLSFTFDNQQALKDNNLLVSQLVQNYCASSKTLMDTWRPYRWSFVAERVTRSDRCATLEEKQRRGQKSPL